MVLRLDPLTPSPSVQNIIKRAAVIKLGRHISGFIFKKPGFAQGHAASHWQLRRALALATPHAIAIQPPGRFKVSAYSLVFSSTTYSFRRKPSICWIIFLANLGFSDKPFFRSAPVGQTRSFLAFSASPEWLLEGLGWSCKVQNSTTRKQPLRKPMPENLALSERWSSLKCEWANKYVGPAAT